MDITVNALLASGYNEFKNAISRADRCFQKRLRDSFGTKYFINFELFVFNGRESYSAEVSCQTDTDGYAWLKFKETTLEQAEERAKKLWESAGSIYYERIKP